MAMSVAAELLPPRAATHELHPGVMETVAAPRPAPPVSVPEKKQLEKGAVSQRILLAVDESRASAEAARLTAVVAEALNASVTVLSVVTGGLTRARRRGRRRSALALASRFANAIACSGIDADYRVRVAEPGRLADQILRTALNLHATLIVLGSRGRRPLAAVLLGSTTHAVAAGAICPVLVVRSNVSTTPQNLRRILVAIDGDAESGALIDAVLEMARAMDAEVEVAHVSFPGQEEAEKRGHHARFSHGEEAMDDVADRLRRAGITARSQSVVGLRGIAGELALEADSQDAGLLVIGADRTTSFVERLFGSVSESLLHATPRAVLITPEPPKDG